MRPDRREPAAEELADRVRRRQARGLSAGPTLSDDLVERLRALLPPIPPPSGGAEAT